MKLFKPKSGSKGFFNKDSLAIVDIKNIDGTDGLLVTYKDGNQVVYENYDKVVDRKGLIKESFTTALSSFEKLNNLSNEAIDNIQIGDIIYYNNEFMIVDNNLLNELSSQIINTTNILDIFKDGSCIACYTFDGNANDLSGNYNGVWSGTEQYIDGKFGQSAYFDGNSYLKIGKANTIIPDGSSFTISLWAKVLEKQNTYDRILGTEDFNGGFIISRGYDGDNFSVLLGYGTDSNNYTRISLETQLNDKFYHIVFGFDKDNKLFFVYLDNKLIYSNIKDAWAYGSNTDINNIDFIIGGDYYRNSPYYEYLSKCYIDQLRIFNRPLSDEEIQILYNEQTPLIKKLSF